MKEHSVPEKILELDEECPARATLARREKKLLLKSVQVVIAFDQIGLLEVIIVAQVDDGSCVYPVIEKDVEVEGFVLRVEFGDVAYAQPVGDLEGRGGA